DADQRRSVLDQVAALFTQKEGAAVRVLMHSLAFGSLKPFIAADPKDALTQAQVEMTMNVMASSLIYWTQDLFQRGMFADGGRIFAMTSSGSHRVLPTYGAVSAAKAALESYCRQLAFELGPRGVTVNAIQAGVTVTPALNKIPGSDQIIANAMGRNPSRRLTTPEDVARALILLASDHANWINGTVIRLDGGEDVVELNWTEQEKSA
ncbi:MAG: SDR family oxidoreductase, partial [Bacteroidota bacterium]